MPKILMIALDGATLDLLNPWMAGGELPLLKRLFDEGAGGELLSTVPWATPTAFASLATGTNPGQHGIYDFGKLIGGDYTAFVPTNGRHIIGHSLWKLLSDAGLSSLVINMPMTYPAEAINGRLVAGIPYPGSSPQLCHPQNLLRELADHGWDLARNASDDLGGSYADYFAGLIELVKTRGEAGAWLLQQDQPDFTALHFLETDQAQHRFWQFMKGEPRHDPNGPHTDAILRLYHVVEQAMAQILAAVDDDTILCVMSDHGFGPTRHQVWLNNWLHQNGFLALKPGLGVRFKQMLYRLGLSPATIREAAPERLKLAILQFFERQKGRALASELEADNAVQKKGLLDRLTERLAIDFYDLDWSQTCAFSTGTTAVGYVWLNVAGRDPQGIVQIGEDYEQTRQQIAAALRQWGAVGEVLFREEVWQGVQLTDAPDIIVRWAADTTDARYFQTRFSSHHLIKPVPNDYASHRPDGMFVWHGSGVREGLQVDADLLDLTPTFLWLLDQPVPTYMDGRILTDCFTLDHPAKTIEIALPTAATSDQMTPEDEEALKNTLRGLGYLE
ncbi:alkaline phosphatase family protein [Candidatus Leptofilum sp.]|uniref:alkaline phosphatase family protein n=1 Tax=Candidatus Leptofilum sp. TaxID=3241576 RepID=UPI003B592DC5